MRDLGQRPACEGVRHDAEDVVALGEAGRRVGGEDGGGEVGAGDFGGGEEGEEEGKRPEGQVHELDVDRVERAGVDAEEEVSGVGGGGRCGGREGQGGGVAACGVGPGFDGGGRGGHGGRSEVVSGRWCLGGGSWRRE